MIQGSASQFIAKSQYGALVVGPSHANILEYGRSRLADCHLVFQAFFSILFLKLCTHSYSCGILFLTCSPIFLKEPSDGSGFIALQYMVDGSWKINRGKKFRRKKQKRRRAKERKDARALLGQQLFQTFPLSTVSSIHMSSKQQAATTSAEKCRLFYFRPNINYQYCVFYNSHCVMMYNIEVLCSFHNSQFYLNFLF